jgi:type II secretory pathway pseudopilin PulG
MMNRETTERSADRRAQEGFSLIELVIVASLLAMLFHMIAIMVDSGSNSTTYAKRLNRVTELSNELMDGMQRDLRSAVRMFGNDATGLAYRSRLEAWTSAAPLGTSTLATLRVADTFRKDTAGTEKTGNELLFARVAWSDAFTCSGGATYRVDVYRIVRYFLKVEATGPRRGTPFGLDLCKWVSEPMADGRHIDAIADSVDRTEVLLHLVMGTADAAGATHPKIEVAWKLDDDPALTGTLRHIQTDGSLSDTPTLPRTSPWRILRDPIRGNAGALSYRWHSVASNYSRVSQGISRFGILNNAGAGFPHGFEVQMIGLSTARQVLLHLTLVSINNKGQRAYHDIQTISHIREG